MRISSNIFNSYKNIIQTIIKLLLCISLYLNPILIMKANAASLGGWTMGNPVAQGASAIVSATKNVMLNGTNVVKTSTALITPTAIDVAKLLGKGVGGVALTFAVEQILGAVDWVLDPANNQIKYKEPLTPTCANGLIVNCSPSQKNVYVTNFSGTKYYGATASEACANAGGIYTSGVSYPCKKGALQSVVTSTANTAYNPNAEAEEREEKTIPLPTVAEKVISNAQSGNADAQVVTTAAAADIINDAENDSTKARPIVNQLENNSKTATDETATGKAETKADEQTQTSNPATTPNTGNTTTDISIDFPLFCGWAPTVCEAMKVVLNVPTLVSDYAESVKDYFKEETAAEENTAVEIEDIPKPTENVNVSIGDNTCPSMPVSIHTPFSTYNADISPTYLCEIASGMKAFVIAFGFYSATLIVGRRK